MGPFRFTQKSVPALLTGTGIITAIAAATTAALVMIGMPPAVEAGPPAPAAPHIVTADWKLAPATAVLTEALNNPPAGWAKQGDLQQLVTAPLPYSCPQPAMAPSVSLARTYTSGGTRFQVATLAYTAGIGAEAMQRQAANAYICAGAETGLTLWSVNGPGLDARQAITNRGGVRAAVLSFRRGDVITYVTGAPSDPLQTLAKAFDDALTGPLSKVCVNPGSTAADATRSPWSAAGYSQFTQEAKVAIPEVPLPATGQETATPSAPASPAPAAGPAPTPAPTTGAAFIRVPIPAPGLVTRTAEPMDRPSFPVSPAMPAAVPEPAEPQAPAAKATTEATLQVPASDTGGPGCGWAFTGMKPLAFDETAATKASTVLLEQARTKLEADAKAWQANVVTYWTDYARYKKDAEAYNAYTARVDEVNKAWSAISATWDTYNRAVEDREQKTAQRAEFIARQNQARKDFETKQAQCAAAPAPSPTATPSPSPSPTGTPSPSPTTSPSPAPTETALPGCPADRPAILDQTAPEVPSEPTPPADPTKK
ncbi:hypothetical protein Achl_4381 (plasmid) [Pseudarthrobacter chlorophenolicus A6]|uniref:Uncharacterized protein n=1 Tax=Pseudarthrobacter chlorophenolicus (strain ATCC 700700 / DSM 12829 / CIP 107037 / JCM 12360 / KCTC 9906 / NCIMB 13794 / A6) TaxID=452863 RepID=B8HIT5_PSECP|nr:hypothetical protein [Pseudarthrobacter chlorophenolicus]ACL42332.1 hypothetical protein Achl_4381 [Pseudarthrobacter chlorophenolicus A6]SDQ16612.1 hypothetical protein SAMN04489738_0438 [Pseudarthrobacter chlorophenolicus]